jgi:hypothetical protein
VTRCQHLTSGTNILLISSRISFQDSGCFKTGIVWVVMSYSLINMPKCFVRTVSSILKAEVNGVRILWGYTNKVTRMVVTQNQGGGRGNLLDILTTISCPQKWRCVCPTRLHIGRSCKTMTRISMYHFLVIDCVCEELFQLAWSHVVIPMIQLPLLCASTRLVSSYFVLHWKLCQYWVLKHTWRKTNQ